MSRNDDDRGFEGPLVVRRPIYEAGMKLEAEVKAGKRGPAFENAREQAGEYRVAGKTEEAAFWTEVFDFLMTRESVGAEAETLILKEGESYDWDEGEVIRPGRSRPRSDMGS